MKTIITRMMFLLILVPGFGQKYSSEETTFLKTNHFEKGFITPAKKKVSTILLNDGKELQGFVDKVKYKKNHIISLVLRDQASEEKTEIDIAMIDEAYLSPSVMEKFAQGANMGAQIKTRKIKNHLSGDESLFTPVAVGLKNGKKTDDFLLQVLNPGFDNVISVYFDPAGKESKGMDVGGMGGALKIGGGVAESYYIKKGDRTFWLRKKDFKKEYNFLFGDNSEFMNKYPYKNVNWKWISALVMEYDKMSGGDMANN